MDKVPVNLYQLLQVSRTCSFDELHKAFRARARECHPDLHGDSPEMVERFQALVNAFDVLSDPESRRDYDSRLAFNDAPNIAPGHRDKAVMDSVADDILEELVVGNDAPRNTTLQTLMLDLEKTERFILFRHARTLFDAGQCRAALALCEKLVNMSPGNILYHYFLAESARLLGRNSKAVTHYRLCLELGAMRTPPQRLVRIRRHYRHTREKQGWFGKFLAWLMEPEAPPELSEEERSLMILEETFAKDERRRRKHALPHSQQRRPRGYLGR